jgi:hypothetical protein
VQQATAIEANMTRYYFHILSGSDRIEDLEGEEFPDPQDAIAEARLSAREMMADDIRKGSVRETRSFEIVDERGEAIAVVPFRDAMG